MEGRAPRKIHPGAPGANACRVEVVREQVPSEWDEAKHQRRTYRVSIALQMLEGETVRERPLEGTQREPGYSLCRDGSASHRRGVFADQEHSLFGLWGKRQRSCPLATMATKLELTPKSNAATQ